MKNPHNRFWLKWAIGVACYFTISISACSSLLKKQNHATTKKYTEKIFFTELSQQWADAKSGAQKKKIWWAENQKNWDLYLKTIYEVSSTDRTVWEQKMQTWLDKFDSNQVDIRKIQENYQLYREQLVEGIEQLDTVLSIKTPIEIYFIPAIVPFDGKEFINEGQPAFALNMMFPTIVSPTAARALIVHEGAHVLHFREQDPVNIAELQFSHLGILIREGLAVNVVKRLFPKESPAFWTILSQPFFDRCQENIKGFTKSLIADLNMEAKEFDKKYFRARPDNMLIPPRCGYAIALQVVYDISKQFNFSEIIKMPSSEYKPLIIEKLNQLAQ